MDLKIIYKILKNLLSFSNIRGLKYIINLKETFIMRKLISICVVALLSISVITLSGCCHPAKHHHEHGVGKVHHEHGDK